MKRAIWLTILAVVAFAVIIIARMPARWVTGSLPPFVRCEHASGSLWNGSCASLVYNGTPIGHVRWDIHASRLLRGQLAAAFDIRRPDGFARGNAEISANRTLTLRDVQANLPLDRALLPQLPPGLSGTARADLSLLRLDGKAITAVQGRVEAHDLEQQGSRLGAYSLTFPESSGEPAGELRSLNGPLDVRGTLRLTPEPGFVLEGQVAAGPGAPPRLLEQLAYLGSPDPSGRRQFSLAGTF